MRCIAYVVATLIGLLLLLIVATGFAVRAWGPELARDRIEAALASTLAREVHVARVDIEFWHGRVVVSGVTASARPGEPGPNVLTLPRVEAQVGVSSLWQRRLVLRWIRLDDMNLALGGGSEGADVTLREIPMLPEVVHAGPFAVELGTIEVRRARLAYADARRDTRATALAVSVTAWRDRDVTRLKIGADEISAETPDVKDRVERLVVEVRASPTWIELPRLVTTWEGRPVSVTGRMDGPFDDPTLDLTVRGDVDIERLGRRFGVAWPLQGIVQATARVQGRARALRVAANVASKEVRVASVTAQAVAARLAVENRVVTVASLKARAFDGSVSGDAVVDLAHAERSHASVTLRDTASSMLEPVAGLQTGINARLDADVDARGDLRDLVRARTRVRVAARQVRLPPALAPLGTGTVDAEATGEQGTFDLASAVAGWPGLRLEASGRATLEGPTPLRVKATGDLARLAPLLGHIRAGGEAVLDAEVTGRWRDPVLAGRLDVRSPAIDQLRADAMAASFALTSRSLRLMDASLRLGRARTRRRGRRTADVARAEFKSPQQKTITLDISVLSSDEGGRGEKWVPTRRTRRR
jgi:hypothetical protein